MAFTVVTQSRGDAARLAEWVTYHHRLGFDDFQIVLDGLVDDSDEVLAALDLPIRLGVHRYPEEGAYFDGLSAEETAARVLAWREENAAWRARLPYPALHPWAVRQYQRVGEVMAPYAAGERGRGWALHIDVDEFLHLPRHGAVRPLVREQTEPRLRIPSFNVDTTGHDPVRPFLEQHSRRWAREDLLAHPHAAWAHRVKTMVRYRKFLPFTSIHKVSRGARALLEPEVARIHHFRIPLQPMDPPLPYRVEDPLRMPPPLARQVNDR